MHYIVPIDTRRADENGTLHATAYPDNGRGYHDTSKGRPVVVKATGQYGAWVVVAGLPWTDSYALRFASAPTADRLRPGVRVNA